MNHQYYFKSKETRKHLVLCIVIIQLQIFSHQHYFLGNGNLNGKGFYKEDMLEKREGGSTS